MPIPDPPKPEVLETVEALQIIWDALQEQYFTEGKGWSKICQAMNKIHEELNISHDLID